MHPDEAARLVRILHHLLSERPDCEISLPFDIWENEGKPDSVVTTTVDKEAGTVLVKAHADRDAAEAFMGVSSKVPDVA